MTTFNDFCKWARQQRRAAQMLNVSEATVSRWAKAGRVPTVDAARNVEAVSHGLFKWTDMLVSTPSSKTLAAIADSYAGRVTRADSADDVFGPAPKGKAA